MRMVDTWSPIAAPNMHSSSSNNNNSNSGSGSSPYNHHHQQQGGASNFHSWGPDLSSSPQHSGLFRRSSTSRGSMRKMLPQTPDMDTQASLAAKMIDRHTSTPRGYHSYGPFFLEYSLLAEFGLLQKQKMPGVYAIPSANNPLKWFCVIFVRSGHYQGGVFRLKLIIPENYPDGDCPRLFFESPLFHPCVDPESGELDLSKGFHKWKRNVNHIWQVLLYARRLMYKMDTREPANPEAAKLYESDREAFKDRVRSSITSNHGSLSSNPGESSSNGHQMSFQNPDSSSSSMDPDCQDPHYIIFSDYKEEVHGKAIREAIQNVNAQSTTHSSSSGMSFMEPGSLKIFSRDPSGANNGRSGASNHRS